MRVARMRARRRTVHTKPTARTIVPLIQRADLRAKSLLQQCRMLTRCVPIGCVRDRQQPWKSASAGSGIGHDIEFAILPMADVAVRILDQIDDWKDHVFAHLCWLPCVIASAGGQISRATARGGFVRNRPPAICAHARGATQARREGTSIQAFAVGRARSTVQRAWLSLPLVKLASVP